MLIIHILYFSVFAAHPAPHFPETLHIITSVFSKRRESEKLQKMWSTWLLFNMVSQAFSGLWWFNSCCYKHLLPALSRSQLRLTQPGNTVHASAFFFLFFPFFCLHYFEHAKPGNKAKRSDKHYSKSTLHGKDRYDEKRLARLKIKKGEEAFLPILAALLRK